MKVEIGKGKNKRMIGEIFPEERFFRKKVKLSVHLFKKLDAFGIDARYFTNVLLPLNYNIEIFESEEGRIYEVEAETFKKHGEYLHFKEKKEDHNSQIFLSRRYWKVSRMR